MLHPWVRRFFPNPWQLGLMLILVWGLPRFPVVIHANSTGDYSMVSLLFLTMWLTPFVFLSREGRRKMGWSSPASFGLIAGAMILGVGAALLLGILGEGLYGLTGSNWYVAIAETYRQLPDQLSAPDKRIWFIIFLLVGMTFSPIGEELLYRGVIHTTLTSRFSDRQAAIMDSGAFALTHLAHFGLVVTASGTWQLLTGPATIWVAALFVTCLTFNAIRWKSGSILGAISMHAGFNAGMTWYIFYQILP